MMYRNIQQSNSHFLCYEFMKPIVIDVAESIMP